jgi:hypothetical protein
MALESTLNEPTQISRASTGLAGFLRDCAAELDGVGFKGVKFKLSEVENEVLGNIARAKAFHLQDRRQLLAGATLTFSIVDGHVNVVDPLGVKGIEFIRHGTTAALLKAYGLDEPYNAVVVAIITKLLSMGITDSIELGKPLSEGVLIFLQQPKTEEEAIKSSVDVVMGALGRFKALSEAELQDFADKYRSVAGRLTSCGIPKFRLTADRILTTIQQEAVRACTRIDVWHRMWRAFDEGAELANQLRQSEGARALPANLALIDKLIQAMKRQTVVLQQHLRNLDRLKATIVNGRQFYIDCLLLIIYVHENKQGVEDMFGIRMSWTEGCRRALNNGSIQGVQNALIPHEHAIDEAIAMNPPPTIKST